MAPPTSRSWVFRNRPKGLATYSGERPTFELVTSQLPRLQRDQVLVRPVFFSNDPAQRGWLDDTVAPERFYVPLMQLDTPMRAFGLAEVVASKADALPVGTLVQATLHWSEYIVLDAQECVPRTPPPNGSITNYLGALGGNGLTAYYGLVVVGEAKAGQRVVVSGAAGATGSMVVQVAKHVGLDSSLYRGARLEI